MIMGGRHKNFRDTSLCNKVMGKTKFQKPHFLLPTLYFMFPSQIRQRYTVNPALQIITKLATNYFKHDNI